MILYILLNHIEKIHQNIVAINVKKIIDNGITLCKKHHEMVTGKEEVFEGEFFKIICEKNIEEVQKLNELRQQGRLKKGTKNSRERYIRKRNH